MGAGPWPATGPAIVIANHPNHPDLPFLIASCRRPLGFLQAREQFHIFLLRHLLAFALTIVCN
jgi:1-acyl-sn-glycerol-3-phosphate acyltransferase